MYLMDLIMMIIMMLVLLVCVLVGVAFVTLMERKVLGYLQLRKGPNKVGMLGVMQPFGDAIKLFTKEQVYPVVSNYWVYYLSPIFSLFLALFLWVVIPYSSIYLKFDLGFLFFFSCLSVSVYMVIISGWSSNSNYALLGSLRAAAQTISYEVSLILFFMSMIFMIGSFNLEYLLEFQKNNWMMIYFLPLGLVWFVIFLAETHRTPFDFSEGESELVSGFNIEYSSGGFALIFLAEYMNIIFMSLFYSYMFLGGNFMSLLFYLKFIILVFLFIWARGTLPRFRYDKLMHLAWKSYLPMSLFFLLFYLSWRVLLMSSL